MATIAPDNILQVLPGRHMGPESQVLKNHRQLSFSGRKHETRVAGADAVDANDAASGCLEPCDHAKKRCLSATGRPDQRHDSVLLHSQRDILQDRFALNPLCNVLDLDHFANPIRLFSQYPQKQRRQRENDGCHDDAKGRDHVFRPVMHQIVYFYRDRFNPAGLTKRVVPSSPNARMKTMKPAAAKCLLVNRATMFTRTEKKPAPDKTAASSRRMLTCPTPE